MTSKVVHKKGPHVDTIDAGLSNWHWRISVVSTWNPFILNQPFEGTRTQFKFSTVLHSTRGYYLPSKSDVCLSSIWPLKKNLWCVNGDLRSSRKKHCVDQVSTRVIKKNRPPYFNVINIPMEGIFLSNPWMVSDSDASHKIMMTERSFKKMTHQNTINFSTLHRMES